jgi:hypothetical protein
MAPQLFAQSESCIQEGAQALGVEVLVAVGAGVAVPPASAVGSAPDVEDPVLGMGSLEESAHAAASAPAPMTPTNRANVAEPSMV